MIEEHVRRSERGLQIDLHSRRHPAQVELNGRLVKARTSKDGMVIVQDRHILDWPDEIVPAICPVVFWPFQAIIALLLDCSVRSLRGRSSAEIASVVV